MADTYSDSNTSNSDESADEGPSNLIAEAKRLGANLRTPEKAKIARERKLQTNPAGKSRSSSSCEVVWKRLVNNVSADEIEFLEFYKSNALSYFFRRVIEHRHRSILKMYKENIYAFVQ